MIAFGFLKKMKRLLPSLEEIKERASELSFQDLVRHRDILLFAFMILVLLFVVYKAAVQPEKKRLATYRETNQELEKQVQVLLDMGLEKETGSLQFELNALNEEIYAAKQEWERSKGTALPVSVSKAIFLREITMLPYTLGWKIITLEEVDEEQAEESISSATLFNVTGEGTYGGLIRYLNRIENGMAPTYVTGMDITSPGLSHQGLQSTLQLRVKGIAPVTPEGKTADKGTITSPG